MLLFLWTLYRVAIKIRMGPDYIWSLPCKSHKVTCGQSATFRSTSFLRLGNWTLTLQVHWSYARLRISSFSSEKKHKQNQQNNNNLKTIRMRLSKTDIAGMSPREFEAEEEEIYGPCVSFFIPWAKILPALHVSLSRCTWVFIITDWEESLSLDIWGTIDLRPG